MTATLELVTVQVAGKNGNATATVNIPPTLKILDDPKEKPGKGWRTFRVLTAKDGDKRVVWDSQSFASIQDAKHMFDDLVSQGLVPYRVGLDGKPTSEVMEVFDPQAEEVVFVPIALVKGG